MPAIFYPEWRDEQSGTLYPFMEDATLTNRDGRQILRGTFLDAALFPVGGQVGMYLANVTISNDQVVLTVGDSLTASRASGTFTLSAPPDLVYLTDVYGRPAGVFVSEPVRLGAFQTWGFGSYTFEPTATSFVPTVCMPTPEIGLRGIQLEDGSFFAGDIWMIGGAGVVLSEETQNLPDGSVPGIRVDIVGDPLFRRRLCSGTSLFRTPIPIERLHIKFNGGFFTALPDVNGDIKIAANNAIVADTVLRIRPTPEGLVIETVGNFLAKQTGAN